MQQPSNEVFIMQNLLQNIIATQDKHTKAIDHLIELWDNQQVFNEMLHDKIGQLESIGYKKPIATKIDWDKIKDAMQPSIPISY